ncbi:MAG: glutathione S-transferase [Alphaproteobacteria bacterium]|nr:glutathione S-transferase [Alphaproteobacteria bacterium]
MLTVWGRTSSINVQKVMWTILHLSLDHERIDAGGKFGGLDSAEFHSMNPSRRIPVLVDGDVTLFESNAIVRYLAARYDEGGLWPTDPGERARGDMWMDWKSFTLIPPMTTVFWQLYRTPEAERDPPAIAKAAELVHQHFAVVDEWLATRPYMGGDRLGLGDIAIGAATYRYNAMPIERPEYRNLETYYSRLQEHPAYREGVMIPLE